MAARTELDRVMRSIRETRGASVQIAEACGINKAAVYQWKRVPVHWVSTFSRVIGMAPEKIRPDIFKKGSRR
jgi:hypothetical protein